MTPSLSQYAKTVATVVTTLCVGSAFAQPAGPGPDEAKKPSVVFPVAPVTQAPFTSTKPEREQLIPVPQLSPKQSTTKGEGLTERPTGKPSALPSRDVDVLADRKPVQTTNSFLNKGVVPTTAMPSQPGAVAQGANPTGTFRATTELPTQPTGPRGPAVANVGVAALALNAQSQNAASHIAIAPGVTEIVPIAKNALNRVVTSFENAKARHSLTRDSGSSLSAHGSVVYVGTYSEQPISAFIVDADDESRAISVVFVPRDIPPREIFLSYVKPVVGGTLATAQGGITTTSQATNPKDAAAWEEGQPYVDMLKGLLRTLALSELPPGYSLSDTSTGRVPRCTSPALRMTLGQLIEGARFTVAVHRAENISPQSVNINESGCYYPGVVAVAAWPRSLLHAGEDTEVYVIHRKDQPMARNSSRPSLVQSQPTE